MRRLTFVVRVKDDFLVVLVWSGDSLPELFHAGSIGDDLVVVATIVMGYNHGIGILVRDVLDGLRSVSGPAALPSWKKHQHRQGP